jgi:hypothetical protein
MASDRVAPGARGVRATKSPSKARQKPVDSATCLPLAQAGTSFTANKCSRNQAAAFLRVHFTASAATSAAAANAACLSSQPWIWQPGSGFSGNRWPAQTCVWCAWPRLQPPSNRKNSPGRTWKSALSDKRAPAVTPLGLQQLPDIVQVFWQIVFD